MNKIEIPADVPKNMKSTYLKNYELITKNTDRLFLFAGDQKIEHLNKDFYNDTTPPEVNNPEHLFKIASKGHIGAFATQLGLISRYGKKYPHINYIAKLNAKTDLIHQKNKDPESQLIWSVEDTLEFKKTSELNICGVGKTIYPGSVYENEMMKHSEEITYTAHKHGLIVILWIYPRGTNIKQEDDPAIVAGAAGIGNCLGADFVKIQPTKNPKELYQAVGAAGNTKILCSGGKKINEKTFLQTIYDQIHLGGTSGVAVGRNVFQRTLDDAIAFTKAISSIVYENQNVNEAINIYKKNK